MTDYRLTTQRSGLKLLLLSLLAVPAVNFVVVGVLKRLPHADFRTRVPVTGQEGRFSTGATGPIMMTNTERCHLAKELYWGNGALQSPADTLALDLAMTLSGNADLFLDIGAYTGLFALAVARRNPQIVAHAYEIVPENFQLLWQNIIRNNLVERVIPHLLGVGDDEGTLTVSASLGPGVLASSVALDSTADDGVTIPVAALDYLFAGFHGRMVFKIDVEGFEWAVLAGARDLIRRTRPDIICEVLRRAPNIPQMLGFLQAEGYNLYRISNGKLMAQKTIVPVKAERDWLFSTRTPENLRTLGYTVDEDSSIKSELTS
jgi:FkbM family methyltransferase